MKYQGGKERKSGRTLWLRVAALTVALAVLIVGTVDITRSVTHVRAATPDWSTWLADLARDGYNPNETILSKTNAANLRVLWTHQSGSQITTEPVIANGLIYWGSWDGLEHATNPSTGVDVWTSNVGHSKVCSPYSPQGVFATATIASESINGVNTSVLYVNGGDDQLYALNANSGTVIWHTSLGVPPAVFLYGSPTVYNGSIYVGVASSNDCPLVQGQMVQVNASTGTIQNIFDAVGTGCKGGSVWGGSTVDASTGMLYFATGNGYCGTGANYIDNVIEVRTADMSLVGNWGVKGTERILDGDFGSTPTLFTTTIAGVHRSMLGLVSKNGIYYAFDRTNIHAGPVWKATVALGGNSPDGGQGPIASSAFDGNALYVGVTKTTINGQSCAGGLQAMNPSTGAFLWQDCLSGAVLAPVVAAPGLVVVEGGSTLYVVDASNGNILYSYTDTSTNNPLFWGPATIMNGVLYAPSRDGMLYAFAVPGTVPPVPTYTPTVLARDTFQRANQVFWGTASDGHVWAGDASSKKIFTITNNTGQISAGGTNSYNSTLGPVMVNAEALLSGSVNSFSNANFGLMLRYTDVNNWYRAYIDGSLLVIQKRVNGTYTTLGSATFAAVGGTNYSIRFHVVGTTLLAKVWVTSTSEPPQWTLSTSDQNNSFLSGNAGIRMLVQAGTVINITAFSVTAQ